MTSDPPGQSPDEIAATMAGDRGSDMQYVALRQFIPEYIDVIMSRLKPRGGGNVAVTDGLRTTYIQEVQA